jgi:hypothetical protein
LNKTDVIFVGTVMEIENPATDKIGDQEGVSRYRFRVDEVLSGLDKSEVDVYSGRGGGDCSYHFKAGEQYVVFPYGNSGHFTAGVCSNTRPVAFAAALLPQLRAMRDTKKVASLYGQLHGSRNPSYMVEARNNYWPIGNVKVQLKAKGKKFESVTDAQGAYAFYDLPADSYRISAALPPNLVLDVATETVNHGLLQLPPRACYEIDLDALPTGRIRGQVLGPDGQRLKCASVQLFIANEYKKGGWGAFESQCEKDHFEFENISPGDYILVFNEHNQIEPSSPFARSYFPGTPDADHATVIHLGDGQQLLDANIHVAAAGDLRELTVRFIAERGRLPIINSVDTQNQDSLPWGSHQIATGILKIFLFKNENYELQGRGLCSLNGPEARTGSRTISSADQSVAEVTLTYPGEPCSN